MKKSTVSRRRVDLAQVAGAAAAGVAAAFAVTVFEAAWKASRSDAAKSDPAEPPPTEVLADHLTHAVTGNKLHGTAKSAASMAVHYATGAGLGVAFMILARRWPRVPASHGTAYGLAVWLLLEELGLPALGLQRPPWRVKPAKHALAATSHLIFGLTLAGILGARRQQSPPPPLASDKC